MIRRIVFLYFIALIVFSAGSVYGQDKKAWLQAKQDFLQKEGSNQEEDRVKTVTALSAAIFPDVEPEAADVFLKKISDEIAVGENGRKEEKVSGTVLDLCSSALKKMTNEKALEKIIGAAKNPKTNWRVRFYVIKGLGAPGNTKVIETLAGLLDDKDVRIKIAALDALRNLKAKEGASKACGLLNSDAAWEFKVTAAQYLLGLEDQSMVDSLISALCGQNLESRARAETANVLKKLTGEDLGLNGETWRSWREKQTAGGPAAPGDKGNTTTAVYYGVEVASTRIAFILDISGSMAWGAQWEEEKSVESKAKQPKPVLTGTNGKPADEKTIKKLKAIQDDIEKKKIVTRMDAAQRELVTALYHLDTSVNFTVMLYSDGVWAWKETLVPATAENKLEAIEEILKQGPKGATATKEALRNAFRLCEHGSGKVKKIELDKKGSIAELMGGPDTVFIVTDGVPMLAGKILPTDDILREVEKFNVTRKIVVNTVGVGSPTGVPQDIINQFGIKAAMPDAVFLAELARITGGVFVDRTTK